jgi:peptidoglycan/LPS O-acetylase OafA/YrhL
MSSHKPDSRNLDLLRAIAVLFVFFSHLILTLTPGHHVHDTVHSPWVALLYGMGNIGVLLFFVHTSLVLLLSLERTRGASLFRNFYVRRLFRIYPLSIACILIVLLLRIPYVPELPFTMPGWSAIVSNLMLVQNLTHENDIISPLWTLPREVQMYAVLPLIFVLLRWIGSIPLVLILWWIAALAAPRVPTLAYVPCFMGGVLAYQISGGKTYRLPASLWPLSLLVVAAFQLWFRQSVAENNLSNYVLCIVVGALVPHFRELRSSRFTDACNIVARYSYGIYLFHLPVIWCAFVKMRTYPEWLQWLVLAALMGVIPWVAFVCLEAPLIETGRGLANRLARRDARAPAATMAASASAQLS